MKKAQAALEVMTTYGWAMLVVVIALGGLFYMVNTDTFVSDTCYTSGSLICSDYTIFDSQVKLKMTNLVGNSINITGIVCTYESSSMSNTYALEVPAGQDADIMCSMDKLPAEKKVKIKFTISYVENGKVFGTFEEGYLVTKPYQ